ncbi:MAG: rhodanese-like domain-containing protein, partial [Gammaproteobacteria bacterium]|nr:rhodanese-like domain-containing protein [Gammaproteobacteria bacterium]
MKLKLALAFIGCLFISSITLAAPILPGVLVDVDWLVENIDDVKILDVRADLDSFLREGHIPGAVVVDTNKVRVTRTINGREITRLIPERKDFDNFIAGHGI